MVKSEKNQSPVVMSEARLKAMDLALVSTRLLDKRYFEDFAKAVESNNKEDFDAVCKKANVPERDGEIIWKTTTALPGNIRGWVSKPRPPRDRVEKVKR